MYQRLWIGLLLAAVSVFWWFFYRQLYEDRMAEERQAHAAQRNGQASQIMVMKMRVQKYEQAIGSCESFMIARDRVISRRAKREDFQLACRTQLQSCIDVVDVHKFEVALQ